MVCVGSFLRVIDNSGVKQVKCIKIFGGFKQRRASIGDLLLVSVKKIRIYYIKDHPKAPKDKRKKTTVNKGDILFGLIVHTKFKSPVSSSFFTIKFFNVSVILLNLDKELMGTRIFGPLPKFFRATRYMRVLTLSTGRC